MSADHWIYGHARRALRGIPTQDLRCDAEDAAHDCVVDVLERQEVEDPVTYAAGSMRRFVRWESMRAGRANHRRHYGAQWLSDGAKGRRMVPHAFRLDAPLRAGCQFFSDTTHEFLADAILGESRPPLDRLTAAARIFCEACAAWAPRAHWAPWVWILVEMYDWRAAECAKVLGCTPSNVRQVLAKFRRYVKGYRPSGTALLEVKSTTVSIPADSRERFAEHIASELDGMTIRAAGERWGVSFATVQRWSRGTRVPGPGAVSALARISDETVDLAAKAYAVGRSNPTHAYNRFVAGLRAEEVRRHGR